MPIYEFACARCKKTFESLVLRKSDEAEVKCPACGSRKVSRLLSRTSVAPGIRADSGGSYSPR